MLQRRLVPSLPLSRVWSGTGKPQGVGHGYPWVPTDQAHSHLRQVCPAYQKTRRHDSGPNRPDLWSTRLPEDLPEDSPGDLTDLVR
jgi:hypothetical protein